MISSWLGVNEIWRCLYTKSVNIIGLLLLTHVILLVIHNYMATCTYHTYNCKYKREYDVKFSYCDNQYVQFMVSSYTPWLHIIANLICWVKN